MPAVPRPVSPARRRRLLFRLAAALLALGSALAGVELLLRLLAPRLALRSSHHRLFCRHDPLLGWAKIEGASGLHLTDEYAVRESFNSRGLRGPEVDLAKPPGTLRVLVLGDSYAEGYTVGWEDLFSVRLERLLEERLPGRSVQVINAGTGGWSTDQELLFLRGEGLRYSPDLTLLLFAENDVWWNAQERYWRGSKPRFRLRAGQLELGNVPVPAPGPEAAEGRFARIGRASHLVGLLRRGWQSSSPLHALLVRAGLESLPDELRVYRRDPDPQVAEAWSLTGALLAAMRDDARGAGGRLLVFHVPWRASVYPGEWDELKRRYLLVEPAWRIEAVGEELARTCAREGVEVVLPLARFRHEAARLGARGERLHFVHDGHWNALGHAFVAELLAERIAGALEAAPPARERAAALAPPAP